MLVEIQKWGNSAAVRIPAAALKETGLQIGQKLDLQTDAGQLLLVPAAESLEDLLARITPENRHTPLLDDPAVGGEAW
ncbi:AbrB/MazE/SpoVT family DNA-binding domain-containing protein [Duganella violaceipulchra]|uniref:AbrB/MazE/SpoVT family DNA-binding domain-containing protein n=1 Tax=Duganella violaceipulchra TaxID=2849652 RepID=A0AA41HAG4_9BURK|nr:AbrB/MazE/SpoVT family DNA-binding domain-containing protein [Duganella violaceicalia]MBV6324978.1 AbrB/MazE/SpoVT family DNA-binding domain-containing protein [Duganella violaceicalia]MCP2009157.1 antitoxin MazE [Duganella violaceicalia]